ncbi:radical SAM protein [Methanohalophilus sp. RSK]|uniref:radical SAM/SPASM domain-containing protein n=1 Tax=Methanohalophilus sp. RSK TaxID=2485783 RepID=UPI000F43A833|nr:radical SAM protein [Methanohalophilus sp. RSK]RNI13957.1 radical SAM protein [Methanohalophilus sp. RSK]
MSGDEKGQGINVFSIPGLNIDLENSNGSLQLNSRGQLKYACSPILKKINERLRKEKPVHMGTDRVIASTWLPPIPSGPFKRLLSAEVQHALGKRVPETVSFEITRQCKCNCDHCIISGGEEDIDTETVKKTIDDALDMGAFIIIFTEGDPLLREDIFELIEYVDKERAIVNMYTPGTDMNPQTARKLKEAGLHNLLVSIYSTDPEKHNAVRKLDGAFDMATDAMKYGLDAGLLVTMCTHASPKNMDELPQLYALATEMGVSEFSIWESAPKKKGDPIISSEDREKVLEMHHEANSTETGPRIFTNSYFEGEMLGCMAAQRWMHICVDGSVKPCPYIPFSFGNIQDQQLKDIWKNMKKAPRFESGDVFCQMQMPQYLELVDKIPDGVVPPYPFDKIE